MSPSFYKNKEYRFTRLCHWS